MNNLGLRQCILAASTPEEIDTLIKTGARFEYASNRTRNAWGRAACRRYKELTKHDLELPKMIAPTKLVNRGNPKRKKHKDA